MSVKFYTAPDKKPGKKNKLKVGQKVKPRAKLVNWYCGNFTFMYGKMQARFQSDFDVVKIGLEDVDKIFFWTWLKKSNNKAVGVIGHYGAHDNDDHVDRLNIWVDFKIKTDLGEFTYGTYVHENDVYPVKGKK
jgi:hypothetical protein